MASVKTLLCHFRIVRMDAINPSNPPATTAAAGPYKINIRNVNASESENESWRLWLSEMPGVVMYTGLKLTATTQMVKSAISNSSEEEDWISKRPRHHSQTAPPQAITAHWKTWL